MSSRRSSVGFSNTRSPRSSPSFRPIGGGAAREAQERHLQQRSSEDTRARSRSSFVRSKGVKIFSRNCLLERVALRRRPRRKRLVRGHRLCWGSVGKHVLILRLTRWRGGERLRPSCVCACDSVMIKEINPRRSSFSCCENENDDQERKMAIILGMRCGSKKSGGNFRGALRGSSLSVVYYIAQKYLVVPLDKK